MTPALSSYWIALVTRTDLALARELVQGLQSDLVPEGPSVWEQIGGAGPLSLEASARHALADERECGLPPESTRARMVAIGLAFGQGDDP